MILKMFIILNDFLFNIFKAIKFKKLPIIAIGNIIYNFNESVKYVVLIFANSNLFKRLIFVEFDIIIIFFSNKFSNLILRIYITKKKIKNIN